MVLVTASGVFGEIQTGLNQAWHVRAPDQPILSILRARVASLGLVAALGFLLNVSLAASTALAALLGTYLRGQTPFAPLLLATLNTLVPLSLFTLLFAAIYKVLPDTPIAWREVGLGAFITAMLFTIGKSLWAQQPPVRAMAQPARWSSFYCGRITARRFSYSVPSLPGCGGAAGRAGHRRLMLLISLALLRASEMQRKGSTLSLPIKLTVSRSSVTMTSSFLTGG
jgi:hypothetical protein